MKILDETQGAQVRLLTELLVPGCARVGADMYIDALLARMPAAARDQVLAAFAALAPAAQRGAAGLTEHVFTPEFGLVRALACEAFYSDFVAPGAAGPGAWQEIDFAPRVAADLRKDWSYLGVGE